MGLIDLFKKKKNELSEHEKLWNNLWNLWSEGLVESPYAELMTYQSEINNGGHGQYFTNIENTGDLQNEMSALETILSPNLNNNLQKAYKAYLILEKNEGDEESEKIIEQCDDVFYRNEQEINGMLEAFAEKNNLEI
ncbi:MAG: DUF4375 domain-containing protein [Clostridia bacterium]|nr:DUF4375 domain-containing protein [Clostridia bacterium]